MGWSGVTPSSNMTYGIQYGQPEVTKYRESRSFVRAFTITRDSASGESHALQASGEGVRVDPEEFGRTSGAGDLPYRCLEGPGGVLPLECLHLRLGQDPAREGSVAFFIDGRWSVGCCRIGEDPVQIEHSGVARDDEGPLQDVFQFTYISGPFVTPKPSAIAGCQPDSGPSQRPRRRFRNASASRMTSSLRSRRGGA